MNNSGKINSNRVDGIYLSLLVVAVFFSLLFAFVGYRCCRRKRSSGKRKALRRPTKKIRKKKLSENAELLKEVLQSSDNDLNTCSKDKKGYPTDTKKAKKIDQDLPVSPASLSPKPLDNNRNSKTEHPRPGTPPLLGKIKSALKRGKDVESGLQHPSVSSTRQSSTTRNMSKQKRHNKGDRNQTSGFIEQLSTEEKDKMVIQKEQNPAAHNLQKPTSSEPSSSLSSPKNHGCLWTPKSGDIQGLEKGGKKMSKRTRSIHSVECTGSTCKKCKPFMETDGNELTDSGFTAFPSVITLPKLTKELQLGKNDETASKSSPDVEKSLHNLVSQNDDFNVEETTDEIENMPDHEVPKGSSTKQIEKTDQQPMEVSPDEDVEMFVAPLGKATCSSVHSEDRECTKASEVYSDKRNLSVGNVYDIKEYASQEWKGDTAKAVAVRKGYFEVPKQVGLHNLRVVRGDNYCAIRATLFQALVKKNPILSRFKDVHKIPKQLVSRGYQWIEDWSFGARFHVQRNEVCRRMEECLKELSDLVNLNNKMENEEGRVSHLLSSLNYRNEEFEIRLMEAVKLLMMVTAVNLHESMTSEEEVPVFAIIMFARDTSLDPCQFMKRHLNAVGDTGGLEQVEMHLLGYTLGICIKVVRPSQFGQPDFIASYPEDMPTTTPSVALVAEDDRHYNILC